MIRRLYIDNFKCLVNLDLKLDDLTLVLGPSGAGKSSVLDVVYGVRRLLSGDAKVTDPDVFPTSTLTRWQDRDLQVVEIEMALPGEVSLLVYRLEVEHDRPTARARVVLERLSCSEGPLFEFRMGDVQLYHDDLSKAAAYSADWAESAMARVVERHGNSRLCRARSHLRRIIVAGLYPRRFEAECRTEDPMLHRGGENFAAWYRHVVQERQDLIPDYIDELREVIDGLRGVRLEKVGQAARVLRVSFDGDLGRFELGFDELSDGQRALAALYALIIITAEQGYSLFLDEPDNYVALAEIQPWLIELSDVCGDTLPQAVLCSHHPELIDYLGPEYGLILRREASGVVVPSKVQAPSGCGGAKLSELVARGWEQ